MAEHRDRQLGNYRLGRRLGQGGSADVYLGEHLFLNTQAAIKVLRTSLSEHDLPAFLQEARTIARLTHPHIIRVLDFGVQDETPFLVMEYAPYGTLRQQYPSGTCLHPTSVIPLVRQIGSALQYAHEQNIVHCDMKPENILRGANDTVLLSDFGISIISQSMNGQQICEVAGTIAYMAPEQFMGRPEYASDQYALAVMVYEWLSGERLFQGTPTAVSGQHLHASPALLSERIPGISAEVDEALGIALAKNPAHRFASMSAFTRALELACGALPEGSGSALSEHTPTILATAPFNSVQVNGSPVHTAFAGVAEAEAGSTGTERVQYAPGFQPAPEKVQPAISRRILLVGLSGGALIAGGLATLVLSGKLSSLFALASSPYPSVPARSLRTASATSHTPGSPTQAAPAPAIGSTLFTYTGQTDQVTGAGWSPADGNVLASSSLDGSVAVWSLATRKTLLSHRQGGQMYALAWSPDGRSIVSASGDGTIQVWDATTGSLLTTYTGHNLSVFSVAWSPDGRRIVSASQDHTAQVWSASDGSPLTTFSGHTDRVWVAAWSPDGKSIATGSFDGTVQIWNPDTASSTQVLNSAAAVRALAWSPDGKTIALGGDNSIVQVWQVATANVLMTYRGHGDHIEAVAWSSNGQSIASGSKDHTVQIWQAATARHMYTYTGHTDLVWSLAWSPNGQSIASASADHTTRVWQAI
jgi:WD40 repeat protein/tRNA A-37 threonylcarbamoyl transferase component Bud32